MPSSPSSPPPGPFCTPKKRKGSRSQASLLSNSPKERIKRNLCLSLFHQRSDGGKGSAPLGQIAVFYSMVKKLFENRADLSELLLIFIIPFILSLLVASDVLCPSGHLQPVSVWPLLLVPVHPSDVLPPEPIPQPSPLRYHHLRKHFYMYILTHNESKGTDRVCQGFVQSVKPAPARSENSVGLRRFPLILTRI